MNEQTKTLSIIVPALNEEGNIRATCEEIGAIAKRHLTDYEILVFDDASRDRTGEVVLELQKQDPHIILFRNETNKGLGYNYRSGVMHSGCQYCMLVPGDNEVSAASLEPAFRQIGETDAILFYAANPECRSKSRQFISRLFTGCINHLFGLQVKYYNGPSMVRTSLAKRFVPETSGFAYMAVMLVQLLKSGYSYLEMPFTLQCREYGNTKAFKIKNIMSVVKNIFALFWRIQIRRELGSHKNHE